MSLVVPSLRGIVASPPWAKNELWRKAQTAPTLDLRFADSKSLTDAVSGQNLITFTRASSGTYVGSDGLIKTALANAPRFDHNPVTGESLGLLIEEQRTNLLLGSDTLATQSVIVTAVAHTLSFYGTGTVTLSGTHSATVAGTGIYPTRTTLTFTPTAGSLTATVSGTVQYAQLEAGSFPTSYIPTTSAQVTRNADVASITGDNFSRWYSQSEGTVFADATNLATVPTSDFQTIAASSDGTNNNRIELGFLTASAGNFTIRQGGSSSVDIFPVVSARRRIAAGAYSSNSAAVAFNGLTALEDTSVVLPTVDKFDIGGVNSTAIKEFNGTIRRLTYFDRRLPNATLQAITSP